MTDAAVRGPVIDPRPRFPVGWFKVAAIGEIEPGAVVERTFLGEQVVAFRTESGQSAVVSAFAHTSEQISPGAVRS